MEERDIFGTGHEVKVDEAPVGFHVAQRTENSIQFSGPTAESLAIAAAMPGTDGKKKRGRPKKYRPYDNVTPYPISLSNGKAAAALSPMPISASIPFTGEFSAWKRGIDRNVGSIKSVVFTDVESAGAGDGVAYSVGANFTAHILTVNAGEDVTMKIMSFSQQGYHAICILSANGTISNVTLRQPTSSGGTLTYEGRFEILSLSGSFMPTENGFTRSRSGGMSVSLAGPDGQVMGGGLAGLLVAASPVQVVVGTFVPGQHLEQQKPKKQRVEHTSVNDPLHVNTVSADEIRISLGGVKPVMMTPAGFQVDNNVAFFNNGQGSRDSSGDDDELSFHERDSNPSQSDAGVAC